MHKEKCSSRNYLKSSSREYFEENIESRLKLQLIVKTDGLEIEKINIYEVLQIILFKRQH